ncbi:MAG: AraC family transcriptional regulator [Eubacteriales bacterium]|nr:AraC family transcriptional regulator [Eubacteriales bacterium]
MGMIREDGDNPFGCGSFFRGDGIRSEGYFWMLPHENDFVVMKCDFCFLQDLMLTMPENSLYISLRLEYARHLPPGKILAYLEERGSSISTRMARATRVAYTEVLYTPSLYKQHLEHAFSSQKASPLEILKNMGGEHNWSSEIMHILKKIYSSTRKGRAAELFYISAAYALMSALIEMGNGRLPKKSSDYECIVRAIQYIDDNFTRSIKLEELSRLANMSATKLKTLFRQFSDCTITEYILSKKADYASHLLTDSDMPISEIAKLSGFDTVAGFSTSFKKQTGLPPSEYRKQIAFYCLKNPSEIKDFNFDDFA